MCETNLSPVFVYNDGGRKIAGFKTNGDPIIRAIAIAAQRPYQEVYDRKTQRGWLKDYMTELGFVWTQTIEDGGRCQIHLNADELPSGRLICNAYGRSVAVIDGVIHDVIDPSEDGKCCVFGYWRLTN